MPRRLGFAMATALLMGFALELIGWAGLSLLEGHAMTPSTAAELRQSAQREPAMAADQPDGRSGQPVPPMITREVVHPYLGFVLDRSFLTELRLAHGGQEALEHGFMLGEPGIFHAARENLIVVAITGGSVAFNLANRSHDRLSDALARRYPTQEIAVVNLALPGHKQPQQLMVLAYFLALGAHFDLVINLDGFNEIALPPAENIHKGVAAHFPRSWYFRLDSLPEVAAQQAEIEALRRRRAARAAAADRPPAALSMFMTFVWRLLDRSTAAELANRELGLLDREAHGPVPFAISGPTERFAGRAPLYRHLVGIWSRSSRAMSGLCRSHGITYRHFLQPNQYVVGSKPMSKSERRVAIDSSHPYGQHVPGAYPLLIDEGRRLAAADIPFRDLTGLFVAVDAAVYVDTCCHVNELGDQMIIDAIAATVPRRTEERNTSGS